MQEKIKKIQSIGKKAQANEFYLILIQVLIALMIYLIIQAYISSVINDTIFEKNYLSKDLSSLMTVLYSVPGNLNYVYSNDNVDLAKFEFRMGNQEVIVGEIDSGAKLPVSEAYAEDLSYKTDKNNLARTGKINFLKDGKNLKIN